MRLYHSPYILTYKIDKKKEMVSATISGILTLLSKGNRHGIRKKVTSPFLYFTHFFCFVWSPQSFFCFDCYAVKFIHLDKTPRRTKEMNTFLVSFPIF